MGYKWNSNFLMGKIEESPMKISWRGNQSLTWDKIFHTVYGNEVNAIYKNTMDSATGEYEEEILTDNMTRLILVPEVCKKIDKIDKWIWFSMNEKKVMKLLVSDPNLQLTYRQNMIGKV